MRKVIIILDDFDHVKIESIAKMVEHDIPTAKVVHGRLENSVTVVVTNLTVAKEVLEVASVLD
jgi:hypothetical protein